MKAQLARIVALDDNRYRVTFVVDGVSRAFVLALFDTPAPGLSAPHSFWQLVTSREATKSVLDAIRAWQVQPSDALPRDIEIVDADTALEQHPVWVSRTADWRLSVESLTWSAKHLARESSNTLFPLPFEHRVIERELDDFVSVARKINLFTHRVSGCRELLAPKFGAPTRNATQLDPLDALLVSAAVYEIGPCIESARISQKEGVVYSFRFEPTQDGQIWDEKSDYHSFEERALDAASNGYAQFVVEADISGFYNNAKPGLIARSLEQIGVPGKQAQAIAQLLESRAEVGLPVGPSSSAMLAESLLIAIDDQLIAEGFRFVRFNDDYRFFCGTFGDANRALQSLARSLWNSCRLSLQGAKTRIVDASEYLEHGKIGSRLGRLKETVIGLEYGQRGSPSALDPSLVQYAQNVLEEAMESYDAATVFDVKRAFSALPLPVKLAELPRLLGQLSRVWSIARPLSHSIADSVNVSDKGQLLIDLVEQLSSPSIPEYASVWLLSAFESSEWGPARNILAALGNALNARGSLARRELLAALRGSEQARQIRYDQTDPWQLRAYSWATGEVIAQSPSRDADTGEWRNLLYRAIAEQGGNS